MYWPAGIVSISLFIPIVISLVSSADREIVASFVKNMDSRFIFMLSMGVDWVFFIVMIASVFFGVRDWLEISRSSLRGIRFIVRVSLNESSCLESLILYSNTSGPSISLSAWFGSAVISIVFVWFDFIVPISLGSILTPTSE